MDPKPNMIMTVLDAAGGAFFNKELEHIKAKSYDIKYADLTYDKVFPVSTEVNPGATHITYHTYDKRGMAKVIMHYAGDLPRVDVDGEEHTIPVRSLGASFGYTIDEINSSKMVGKQLDRRRAGTARRAVEELQNKITWLGDAVSGLVGLLTHPNIPSGNAPNGAGGTAPWDTKTPLEIRNDINLGFRTIFETTKMVEKANTVCLTPKNYSIVMETALSADNPLTIAQWFVKNSPHIKSIDDFVPVPELEGVGTGGVDIMLFMDRNSEKCEVEIPQDVFFHEVEKRGLEYITDVTSRFGGLNVYYPLSMYILEDV